jgi:hypothetical protein
MKYLRRVFLMPLLLLSLPADANGGGADDDDPEVELPRMVITPPDYGPAPRIPSMPPPILPGPPQGGGPNGGGDGSGPSGTESNPQSTPGVAQCRGTAEERAAEASENVRLAQGGPMCPRAFLRKHFGRYYSVRFTDGSTGIYRGIGSCTMSTNVVEIRAPNC